MNNAITHLWNGTASARGSVLPSEAPGLSGTQRRALRKAERAHGISTEARERANAHLRTITLPTGRRSL